MNRRIITCRCCGEQGTHRAHGWRWQCYQRWLRTGRPTDGPPPINADPRAVTRAARAANSARAAGRCEDYVWLRDEQHLTREQAAARLGVTERTIQRYEARLRNQQKAGAAA